jgi:hypothetical protein
MPRGRNGPASCRRRTGAAGPLWPDHGNFVVFVNEGSARGQHPIPCFLATNRCAGNSVHAEGVAVGRGLQNVAAAGDVGAVLRQGWSAGSDSRPRRQTVRQGPLAVSAEDRTTGMVVPFSASFGFCRFPNKGGSRWEARNRHHIKHITYKNELARILLHPVQFPKVWRDTNGRISSDELHGNLEVPEGKVSGAPDHWRSASGAREYSRPPPLGGSPSARDP